MFALCFLIFVTVAWIFDLRSSWAAEERWENRRRP